MKNSLFFYLFANFFIFVYNLGVDIHPDDKEVLKLIHDSFENGEVFFKKFFKQKTNKNKKNKKTETQIENKNKT